MATKNYKVQKNSYYHLAVSATGYHSQELRDQLASANRTHSISLLKKTAMVRFNITSNDGTSLNIYSFTIKGSSRTVENAQSGVFYQFDQGESLTVTIYATDCNASVTYHTVGSAVEQTYNITMTKTHAICKFLAASINYPTPKVFQISGSGFQTITNGQFGASYSLPKTSSLVVRIECEGYEVWSLSSNVLNGGDWLVTMTAKPTTVTLTIKTSQPTMNIMVHTASTNQREGTVSGSGINWTVTGLKTNVSYILTCTPTSVQYKIYEQIITLTADRTINVIYLQSDLGGGGIIDPGGPGIIDPPGVGINSVQLDETNTPEDANEKTKRKRKSKN